MDHALFFSFSCIFERRNSVFSMNSIKTILVPIDFSKSSENGLEYALLLSGKLGAKVILYHSFFSPHTAHLSVDSAKEGKSTAYEISVERLEDVYVRSTHLPLQEVEYYASPLELREELPQIVHAKKIDLIVMGTQGAGWLEGRIFGTNTSWTIQRISCPVIAIPEREQALQIKHVVYASGYLDSDIHNLEITAQIASLYEATLSIVHVVPPGKTGNDKETNDFKERLKKELPVFNFQLELIQASSVEQGLEDYLDHHPVDLLVMSAQRRDLYDKVFGKSITRLMVHHLNGPALFFHHERASH
jgi:nucleotide-binding universal stress UspA family protein